MSKIRRWKDVPGCLILDNIYKVENKSPGLSSYYNSWLVYEGQTLYPPHISSLLAPYISDDEYIELVIHFRSSGYYDPGSIYGGPYGVGWPPESEDNRVLDYAALIINNKLEVKLPKELGVMLMGFYEYQIEEIELVIDDD